MKLLWTKNSVLNRIQKIIGSDVVGREGNSLYIVNDPRITIDFIASNYSDEGYLEMNATIHFDNSPQIDLFNICKKIYGRNYRCLKIKRESPWEGSDVEREVTEVYQPLFSELNQPGSADLYLRTNKKIKIGNKKVRLKVW
jgi:hypothetical protein